MKLSIKSFIRELALQMLWYISCKPQMSHYYICCWWHWMSLIQWFTYQLLCTTNIYTGLHSLHMYSKQVLLFCFYSIFSLDNYASVAVMGFIFSDLIISVPFCILSHLNSNCALLLRIELWIIHVIRSFITSAFRGISFSMLYGNWKCHNFYWFTILYVRSILLHWLYDYCYQNEARL